MSLKQCNSKSFHKLLKQTARGIKPTGKPPGFFAGIAEGLTNHKMTEETPEEA